MCKRAVLNYSLSHIHLHLSHTPFTGPPVMSHRRVKIGVERKAEREKEGTGAGNEKSSNDEMKGSGINKRAK